MRTLLFFTLRRGPRGKLAAKSANRGKVLLPLYDANLFFRLQKTLLCFVNQQVRVSSELLSLDDFAIPRTEEMLKVRDELRQKPDLIDSFLQQNPADLSTAELAIVSAWRHQVAGTFYIFRELKKHTIFLSSGDASVAYGVVALTQPFDEIVPWLPALAETVLLPFKNAIIYDGLLRVHNVSFGSGIRLVLNEKYKLAKERSGIITALPLRSP